MPGIAATTVCSVAGFFAVSAVVADVPLFGSVREVLSSSCEVFLEVSSLVLALISSDE